MNKSLKASAVVLSVIVTAGCGQRSAEQAKIFYDADKLTFDINTKNGLCFSALQFQWGGAVSMSHSNVPCTDKVLEQVNQGKLAQMKEVGIEPVR